MNAWLRRAAVWFACTLGSLVAIAACAPRVADSVPNADIVFQSTLNATDPETLGFIDADGSNLTYVKLSRLKMVPACPTWAPDGDYLLFRGSHSVDCFGDLYAIGPRGKVISYPRETTFGKAGAAINLDGEHFVAHEAIDPHGVEHLNLLDTVSGDLEATLVSEIGRRAGISIGPNALRDSMLVFTHSSLVENVTRQKLISRNLNTGQESVLVSGETVMSPSISPDGRWVAYTARDGIYLIDSVDGASRRLVATAVLRETSLGLQIDRSPPVASWSPDSRWVVYHRCVLPGAQYCYLPSHYSVFKVDVETGEETLLVEQALNPYWRLRQG